MQKVISYVCTVFGVLLVTQAWAQYDITGDSIRELPGVTVSSDRFDQFASGTKIVRTDSLTLSAASNNSLAQLLSFSGQVFVKSYGQGSLATTSFRGAGASHTAVLWNGFNLSSPMNGQLDLSLVGVGLMNDVSVQYGGNTALFGSGAIGGAVRLNNRPLFKNGVSANVNLGIGSFGFQSRQLGFSIGSKRVSGSFKYFKNTADNDFPFENIALFGSPKVKQEHAGFFQEGFIANAGWIINSRQQITFGLWGQITNRNIPPLMTTAFSTSFQRDAHIRATGEWKYTGSIFAFAVRSALFDETLDYFDELTSLQSFSRSQTNITEAEMRFSVRNQWQFNIGLNNTFSGAASRSNEDGTGSSQRNGYRGNVEQNRTTLFGSAKYTGIRNLRVTVSGRQELVDEKFVPATATFGADYKIISWLSVMGQVNRSYRLPTFNDLFWVTGNRQLKPEYGWGQELSLKANTSFKNLSATITATGFNRNINDWIIWLPAGGGWTPQNIRQVWSRGAELNVFLSYKVNRNLSFQYKTDLSYILSTNEKVISAADSSIGKQLIYVPRLMHQHHFTITYKRFYVTYNHTYTGIRFTSTDNLAWLPYYTLGNVFAGYGFSIGETDWALQAQANNVWNETYQALLWRPMPLINYQVTLIFTFKHYKK